MVLLLRARSVLLARPSLALCAVTLQPSPWRSAVQLRSIRRQSRPAVPLKFACLPAAVEAFHASAGHYIVPFNLVVPGSQRSTERVKVTAIGRAESVDAVDWPEEARGFALGRLVRSYLGTPINRARYPQVEKGLRDIGFPVDIDYKEYVWEKQYLAALRAFSTLHGHSLVPRRFTVPRGDPSWPIETWGLHLGTWVSNTRERRKRLSIKQVDQLEEVGCVWDVIDSTWSEEVLPALEIFKEVYGHLRIKKDFVVPSHAPWPKRAWGSRLGFTIGNIRSRGDYSDQTIRDASKLTALGFVWDFHDDRWSNVILPAFETYYAQHGHCNVSAQFIVPTKAPWPEATWDLKLGMILAGLKYRNCYSDKCEKDRARLEAIKLDEALRKKSDT